MNSLQGVTPSFEISVMQFSKTTFIKLFVTLGYAFVGYSHRFRRRTCHTVCEFAANAVNDMPISIAVDSIDATSFLVNFLIPYIPFHILKQLFYFFFDYIFLLRITVITSPRISFFDTAPSVLLSLDTL